MRTLYASDVAISREVLRNLKSCGLIRLASKEIVLWHLKDKCL